MFTPDAELARWAEKGQRVDVTLGQMITLLELAGHDSVASLAPESISHAVNYRQKLDRLEKALAIGRLTKKVGNTTRVSDLGRRVAGEVRLLLMGLSRLGADAQDEVTWIFGAGETWLQTIVIPTLARWPHNGVKPQWQVVNLKTHDLCDALREGRVHFGLVRSADLKNEDGLSVVREFPGVGQCVLMSGAPVHRNTAEAIRWALKEKYPLIQQGTSWVPYRAALEEIVGKETVANLEPAVLCETHPQAATSVVNGRGWTVVPSIIVRNVAQPGVALWELRQRKSDDDIALITCGRVLDKMSGGSDAASALKHEIGLTISGAKR